MNEIKINELKYLAIKAQDEMMTNEDLRKRNLTKTFWKEFYAMIENKELVNIQIIGEKTLGKSIIMCLLVTRGNEKLGNKMGIWAIKADQSEYGEYIRTKNPRNVFNGIDEWNEMAETGAGATTEKSFLNYQSDVSAQEFRHRISCSPSTVVDEGATIILEVIGKNVKAKINRCLIKYRLIGTHSVHEQLIGFVDFFVGELVATEKNKNSWYRKYREKKYARMRLMGQYGIQNPRELEQAPIVLELFEELKDYAKTGLVSRGIIKSFIKVKRMEKKQLHSIILTEELTEELDTLLRLQTEGQKKLEKIRKLKKKGEELWKIQNEELAVERITKNKQILIDSYKRKIEINKEYNLKSGELE